MANKLTKETLKMLIEEMLNEKKINLDTRSNRWGDIKKELGVNGPAQVGGADANDAKRKVKALAKLDNDATSIADADFVQASKLNNADPTRNTAVDLYTNSSKIDPTGATDLDGDGFIDFEEFVDYLNSSSAGSAASAATPSKKQLAAAIIALLPNIKAKNDADHKQAKALLKQLKKLYTTTKPGKSTEYGKAFDAIENAINALASTSSTSTTSTSTASHAGTIDKITKALLDVASIDAEDIEMANPLGSLNWATVDADADAGKSPTMTDVDKAITATKATFSQDIVNSMALFGNTIEDKMSGLEETANAIASKKFPTTTSQQLQFSAKARVLIELANFSKTFDASSAGFQFEKFCCAFFNGVGIGGANGAIDTAVRTGGKWIPTSQKLIAGDDIKQALGGKIGVDAVLKNYNSLIYFAFQKVEPGNKGKFRGSSEDYTNLQVFVIKINKDYSIDYLDKTGNWNQSTTAYEAYTSGGDKVISYAQLAKGGDALVNIPVLDKPGSAATEVADYIKTQFTGQKTFEKLIDIQSKLENMKRNTISYETTGGSSKTKSAAGHGALDYIKQISTDYLDAKDLYKDVFETAEKGSTTGTAFAESKKITPNHLKKLIEESFKKNK